jgi:hypothetical protein
VTAQPAQTDAKYDTARAYCLAKFNYTPDAYISPEARERHIDNDARSTAAETWFSFVWDAAFERGRADAVAQLVALADHLDADCAHWGVTSAISPGLRNAADVLTGKSWLLKPAGADRG